jgi:hypothetical protein
MSEYRIYYLILDVTNHRLIGGHFDRAQAKANAQRFCVRGEYWLLIETTNNKADLEVWSAIYQVVHLE